MGAPVGSWRLARRPFFVGLGGFFTRANKKLDIVPERWYYPLSQLLKFKTSRALQQIYERQHTFDEPDDHPLARPAPSGAFFANIRSLSAPRQFRGRPLKGPRRRPAISVFRLPEARTHQEARPVAAVSGCHD
jgi:hypothetical protein